MNERKTWTVNEDTGECCDNAKVKMTIIGPPWSPLLRFRIYMDHQPNKHLTHWYINRISKYIGSYTPPSWFLKLIGQIEDP